jgi:hypothetical protein
VRRVVLKAMAPKAADRYQSGAEFSRALRDALAITYPSGPYPRPTGREVRRRGVLLAVAILTVIGLLASRGCA